MSRARLSAHESGRAIRRLGSRVLLVATIVSLLVGLMPTAGFAATGPRPAPDAAAGDAPLISPTNHLTLSVRSLDDNNVLAGAITEYQWLISIDDTGNPTQAAALCAADTNPNYPDGCEWPSVHTFTGGAGGTENLLTQGNQDDLNTIDGLDLPDGDYLISVMTEDHKIDGAWFSIPMESPGLVTVGMQQNPLPLSTIRIQVFDDTITNGQYDQAEHGLAGFKAHPADVLAEITTDWFGNPICGEYDGVPNGDNYIPGTGGECVSDADGLITIPNLGSNRFSVQVVPPSGTDWVQTSTLEGSHDWDIWSYEGSQGYLRELIVNGDLVPVAWFGYIRPTPTPPTNTIGGGTGRIQGHVVSTKSYLPPAGGDTNEGGVPRPWISIADLGVADQQVVFAGRGDANGFFDIGEVPDSTYSVSMWDHNQDLLLGLTTVVVEGGATVDIGDFALSHWFSKVSGYVFVDENENGRRDAGELPLVGQSLVLKSRDNSLVDAGSAVATTDIRGYYEFTEVYPYGYWTVLESYNDRYYTTGVTYQADTAPPVTRLGAGVDVSMFNMDGIPNRVDWGVLPYAPGTNGGIVGEVVYNLTRNELDARLAAAEDYEPGIPGMTVNLYAPVPCPSDPAAQCTSGREWLLAADGSVAKGTFLNTYITEEFQRPTDCQYRNAAGVAQPHYPFMSAPTGGHECIEAPLMGGQIKTGPAESAPPAESEFTLVNGNYGFGDGCFDTGYNPATGACFDDLTNPAVPVPVDFRALEPGDYLVEVVSPVDSILGRPKFKVTREEDINVFGGDQFAPAVPPHPCAGAMHTVDVLGIGPDDPATGTPNPTFVEVGGSPFEGQQMPLCDVRLVNLGDRRSTAPGFSYFTDVPQPGRLFGATVEDLALGTNSREFYYGEKAGIPNSPVGVYDYTGRLLHTFQTDPNGFFEILLPSTRTFNCPLPAGPCPNVYRLVGNDPGQPGHPNPNYDPQYRSMETDWQIWPGLTLLADIALIPTSPVIEFPGTQGTHPPDCNLEPTRPQLFSVSTPYVNGDGTFSIEGQGFGAAPGQVKLDGTLLLPTNPVTWTDRHIDVTIPIGTPPGAHELTITGFSGLSTINGLTFHVLGGTYTPSVWDVGPGAGMDSATIQGGIELANAAAGNDLVVVWPNTPGEFTPLGDYYENIVIHSAIKLQGVGPGGVRSDGTFALGSVINGIGFATVREHAWDTFVDALRAGEGWAGNQTVFEGAGIYVVASATEFTSGFKASIDGFKISGADALLASEFNGRLISLNAVQAGGIFVNAYARYLQITNNEISGNGGSYGGAIRVGTPYVGDGHNDGLRIAHNRIVGNGGTNLAGAIGLFAGTNGYEIDHNDICGNFSAEYGGGISQFGLSSLPSTIHHNRIWFNGSYDEGGGIMIGGELPDAGILSPGAGPVDIYANAIQANLANDDGGGIRLLMAGNFPINVYNNFIVNNVSTHEGGGVALDDATNVRFFNNTVVGNLTTATAQDAQLDAATGNTIADPAGLSDTGNSELLQETLPAGHAPFSDPLLFNNIFWDNRSGHYDSAMNKVIGIGQPGDATPIHRWDMGVVGPGLLSPTNSILHAPQGTNPDSSNQLSVAAGGTVTDPGLLSIYELHVATLGWRAGGGQTAFIFVHLITDDMPPGTLGNYHLQTDSVARNTGASAKNGTSAPATDIDDETRPVDRFDIGGDEEQTVQPVDLIGPIVSGLTLTPNRATTSIGVTIGASASDAATGGSLVDAAEYFLDSTGADGAGTALTIAAPGVVVATSGTILSSLVDGTHSVHVHARDAAGNWGAYSVASLVVDHVGPATSSLAISPNPTVGAAFANLSGVASDVASGGTAIGGAEWWDGAVAPAPGFGTALAPLDGTFNSPTESIATAVPLAGWSAGTHTIRVRSRDALGNWGAASTIAIVVSPAVTSDVVGPVTSAFAIQLGTRPRASITFKARTSELTTGRSNIAAAEWFEGVDPGLGHGHALAATDGRFDEVAEEVRSTINITSWSTGPHMIRIRSKDARGNWGTATLAAVVIDASPNVVVNPYTLDDFASGSLRRWSRVVGAANLSLGSAAAMDGSPGLSLRLVPGTSAYIQDDSPVVGTEYHARFKFNPHGAITGTARQVLLLGRSASGGTVFQLEFRHASGGAYQVRPLIKRTTGLVAGRWVAIPNRAVVIELSWSAPNRFVKLYVNGVLRSSATTNTSSLRLEQVRLGSAGTLGAGRGTEYIDGFVSSRTTFIGS